MAFLVVLGIAGWSIAAYVYTRFRRGGSNAIAVRHTAAWLLVALCGGITLIDAHAATQASQPDSAVSGVLLILSILWFTLPYILVYGWWICSGVPACRTSDEPRVTSRLSHPLKNSDMTWRERFLFGAFTGAAPTFMLIFFTSGTFVEASAAAACAGVSFGLLAAVFGKRMLEFLMSIPW